MGCTLLSRSLSRASPARRCWRLCRAALSRSSRTACSSPEVLKKHARHIETGQPMPDELIATAGAGPAASIRASRPSSTRRVHWSTWRCNARDNSGGGRHNCVRGASELARSGMPREIVHCGTGYAHFLASVRELGLCRRPTSVHVAEVLDADGSTPSSGRQSVRPGARGKAAPVCLLGRQPRSNRARRSAHPRPRPRVEPMPDQRGLTGATRELGPRR